MNTKPVSQGNIVLGLLGGIFAALLAAVVWGAITAVSQFQIGYMAIGVGFVVAFSMRAVGRGHDARFKWAAAIVSLFGCVLGNFFAVCAMLAARGHESAVDTVIRLAPRFTEVIQDTFQPMDLLFYAFGAYFGFKYAATPPRQPVAHPAEESA